MTTPKLEIIKCVNALLKKNYILIYQDWGDVDMHCSDALGCVLIQNDIDDLTNPMANTVNVAKILNVSENWVDSFVDGFDGLGESKWAKDPEGWSVGKELRDKFNPILFIDYVASLEE